MSSQNARCIMVVCTSNPVFEITVFETLADGANSPGFYFFKKTLQILKKFRFVAKMAVDFEIFVKTTFRTPWPKV